MRVLSISSDRSLFREGSAARSRAEAYALALGELHLVVFTLRAQGLMPFDRGALHVYPTHSFSRFLYPVDAMRIARRIGGDVVTTQDPFETGLAGARVARVLGVPLHVQLHTDPFAPAFARSSFLNRIRLRIMPHVIRRASRIRVVAPRLKQGLIARYGISPDRVSVLPIYADLARFRMAHRLPEKGRLLWIGRFEREKDPLLALEALATCRAAGIDARLTMLGEGRLMKALRARAKVRGLAAFLELPGHADPLPYLEKAELVLATSRYEGYGLAIVEALAAGVPVLSTDVGIAREAGAIIASSRIAYAKEAAELLTKGPSAPPLVPDPYPSFEAYVAAYAKDIQACTRQGP